MRAGGSFALWGKWSTAWHEWRHKIGRFQVSKMVTSFVGFSMGTLCTLCSTSTIFPGISWRFQQSPVSRIGGFLKWGTSKSSGCHEWPWLSIETMVTTGDPAGSVVDSCWVCQCHAGRHGLLALMVGRWRRMVFFLWRSGGVTPKKAHRNETLLISRDIFWDTPHFQSYFFA
jgi:hypothetical protein